MNKHMLKTIVLLAVCFAIFACDNSKVDQVKVTDVIGKTVNLEIHRPENVTLNWMGHWKGEGKREQLVNEVKKEFEFLHPGVEVNLVFNKDLPGKGLNFKTKPAKAIVEMIKTGTIDWDVIFLDVAVYEYVTEALNSADWVKEHLVDFSEVPGFIESQKDFIVNNTRYRDKVGGIFTGPFIECYLMNLWYNTENAKKIGIRIKERGMTFDDFLEYAEKLHNYNRLNNTSIPFIKLSSWNRIDALFENLFKSLFKDFADAVSPEFNEKKKEAFLVTLKAFEKLSRFQPILEENWEKLTFEDMKRQYLLEDDGLFIMGGTFLYGHFRGLNEKESKKMKPAENPYLAKTNGLVGEYVPVFAVMNKSENRQLAIDLVMAWSTPKVAEKWVRYTKNLTGIKGNLSKIISAEADVFDDVYEAYILDMEKEYSNVPMMYLRTPTYVFGNNSPVTAIELRQKLGQILEGKLSAEKYFNDVMQRMEN